MRTRSFARVLPTIALAWAAGGCGALLGLDDFAPAGGGGGDASTSGATTTTGVTTGTSGVASTASTGAGGDGGGPTSDGGGGTTSEGGGGTTSEGGGGTTSEGGGGEGGFGGAGGEGGGPVCAPGVQEACYEGAAGTLGVGLCEDGVRRCDDDGHFGACEGQVVPAAENCQTHADESCSPTCGELRKFYFYGGPGDEIADTISTFENGDFLVTGTNFNSDLDFGNGVIINNPQDQFFMARITPDGTAVWGHILPAYAQAVATGTFVTVVGNNGATTVSYCGVMIGPGATYVARFDGADGLTCLRAGVVGTSDLQISDVTSPLILRGQRTVRRVATSGAMGFVDSWTFTGPSNSLFSGVRTRGGLHYVFGSFSGSATFGGLAPLVANGASDGFVVRLNTMGVPEAAAKLGVTGGAVVRDIEFSSPNLYLAGSFNGSMPDPAGGSIVSNETNYFVTRASFAASLAPIWTRSAAGLFTNITLHGGNLLLLGRGDDFGGGNIGGDASSEALVAFGGDGSHLWSRRIGLTAIGMHALAGGGARLLGYAGVATDDVFGSVDVPAAGGDDFWIADLFPVVP